MNSWTSSSSSPADSAPRVALIGGIVALPWCCLVPAALSFGGMASAGLARAAIVPLRPYLLIVAAVFLGRAHYLVWVRRQGTGWSRGLVIVSTLLAVGSWLWPWLLR